MNPHKQGYTKKLGDTLRENEALKAKIAALESACTYEVMSKAIYMHSKDEDNYNVSWNKCVLAALSETNSQGGEQ